MNFINKGNFEKAHKELKSDSNNAVECVFEKEKKASGKLKDVIFTIKNNYAKDFSTTTGSSNILLDFNPGYNATILNKLLTQGATLVATTNLDEFGLGGTGEYSNNGLIMHPLNRDYYVGGSSSGSAATFTKNIGFAIGSDTGDSVRLPASFIGKVGFKPSYGAVSRYGLFAYASSLDTVAWFTHNVNDCAIISQILYGKDKLDLTSTDVKIDDIKVLKPKKIAYLNCFDFIEDYVAKEYKRAINQLSNDHIEMVSIKPDVDLLCAIQIVYEIISFSEASSNLSNLTGIGFGQRKKGEDWEEIMTNTRSKGFGFMVQRRLTLGSYYLEKENQEKYFLKAQKVRRLIWQWYNQILEKYDVIIFPSSPTIAPNKRNKTKKDFKFMPYILTIANLVGNPSLNMKLGSYNDMPFNLTIDAKRYSDEKLLSHGLYIEKILGANND